MVAHIGACGCSRNSYGSSERYAIRVPVALGLSVSQVAATAVERGHGEWLGLSLLPRKARMIRFRYSAWREKRLMLMHRDAIAAIVKNAPRPTASHINA